jgi:hypothetical protein
MIYTKPQILDSCRAHECIQSHNKFMDSIDGGHEGVQGTATAYEADE